MQPGCCTAKYGLSDLVGSQLHVRDVDNLCGEQHDDGEVVSTPLGVSCANLQHRLRGSQAGGARRDASSLHPEHLPILGASGDLQPGLPMYCGHLCRAPKDGIRVADSHLRNPASVMPGRPAAGDSPLETSLKCSFSPFTEGRQEHMVGAD